MPSPVVAYVQHVCRQVSTYSPRVVLAVFFLVLLLLLFSHHTIPYRVTTVHTLDCADRAAPLAAPLRVAGGQEGDRERGGAPRLGEPGRTAALGPGRGTNGATPGVGMSCHCYPTLICERNHGCTAAPNTTQMREPEKRGWGLLGLLYR